MPMPACTALRLAVTTMDPPAVMCGAAALIMRYGPVRFTSSTRDHSATSRSTSRATDPMPALAKAKSRPPKRQPHPDEPFDVGLGGRAARHRRDRLAELLRHRTERLAVEVADDDPRPSDTSRRVVASPMPDAPPVTTATFPATRGADVRHSRRCRNGGWWWSWGLLRPAGRVAHGCVGGRTTSG